MLDVTQRLKSLDSFNPLGETSLKELSSHFEIVYVKNREILFKEDTPLQDLYIVLYGSFKIQKKGSNSSPVILNFLNRGEFLGIAMAGLTYPVYPATAVANEDAALLRFSRNYFLNVLMKIDSVRATVTRQISERFLEFQHDRCMENVRTHQRVADLLLRLLDRQGEKSGSQILIPLTRKDIAQRVGTKAETVIRILRIWNKKGWIKTVDRHIAIINYQQLKEVRDERTPEYTQVATSDDFEDVEPA
nr:Crp/Fnr family transcriptional regulator [uncultured Bdellovibrio sp.]